MGYDFGRGVARDISQAVAWYRKAAEQGYAKAQSNLGALYADGDGVGRDEAQAVAWWRKAAEQGHPRARINLGVMYAEGRGVPPNLPVAYALLGTARLPEDLAGYRDRLAAQMSPAQIAQGRKLEADLMAAGSGAQAIRRMDRALGAAPR